MDSSMLDLTPSHLNHEADAAGGVTGAGDFTRQESGGTE